MLPPLEFLPWWAKPNKIAGQFSGSWHAIFLNVGLLGAGTSTYHHLVFSLLEMLSSEVTFVSVMWKGVMGGAGSNSL